MWRFILISFAFLGWSFYILSGGSDYEPRTQSIQARAKLDNLRPVARPEQVAVTQLAETSDTAVENQDVTRSATTLASLDPTQDERFQIVLASVSSDTINQPLLESEPAKTQVLTEVPDIAQGETPETEPSVAQDTVDTVAAPVDLRRVTGSVVNMRDGPSTFYLAIGKLKKDTEVEVLDNSGDGWLKIRVPDTGQVGWMADWLVTAASN